MLQCLGHFRTKVILPLVFKVGRTPKQSPSILERCIIGWWLSTTYASLLLAWMYRMSWITIPGVKSSMTRNLWNRRDSKRQRNHKRRCPSPRDERTHLNYPAQRSPKDHGSGMLCNTFCLIQLENISWCPFWIFLDPHGFVSWVSPSSMRQTVTSFFSHNVYDVMVLSLTVLTYVSILTC